MTRLRQWWTGCWQAIADFLESLGDIGDFPDDFLD